MALKLTQTKKKSGIKLYVPALSKEATIIIDCDWRNSGAVDIKIDAPKDIVIKRESKSG